MTKKLKRCPFCGEKAILEKDGRGFRVICSRDNEEYMGNLVVGTEWYTKEEYAIETWNTRPAEDSLRKEIKELKKHLKRAENIIRFYSEYQFGLKAKRYFEMKEKQNGIV